MQRVSPKKGSIWTSLTCSFMHKDSKLGIFSFDCVSPRRDVHKLRSPPMFQGVGAGYWV